MSEKLRKLLNKVTDMVQSCEAHITLLYDAEHAEMVAVSILQDWALHILK